MNYNYSRSDMNMALEYFKQKKVPNFVDVVSSTESAASPNRSPRALCA